MKKLVIAVLVIALVGCTGAETAPQQQKFSVVDATEQDIIPLLFNSTRDSTTIAVDGVQLGDSRRDVTAALGAPTNLTTFTDSMNYEYKEGNETTLIVRLENNSVTRITMQDGFNDNLHGQTTINGSKSDVYTAMGLPETREIVFKFIVFEYHDEGVETIMFRGDEFGLSLLHPQDVNESLQRDTGFKAPLRGELQIQ